MLKLTKNANSAYIIYIIDKNTQFDSLNLSKNEVNLIKEKLSIDLTIFQIQSGTKTLIFTSVKEGLKYNWVILEEYRKNGFEICNILNKNKSADCVIVNLLNDDKITLTLAESIALSNYQFLKYFSDSEKRKNTLETINVTSEFDIQNNIDEINNNLSAIFFARDLVNEPLNGLNAVQLAEQISTWATLNSISAKVMHKEEIEAEKMGGLLAVNIGAIEPPTFTILEYKPENHKNSKPIVLVGKGVVYDTGGLSLKPTPDSMDFMKSDMGGAALVSAVTIAASKNKLPLHIITLIPATENRPGGNAYTPGDVIKMYDGSTVEVLNTDAEGRMILADALHWAKRYQPELVIDAATLTGIASMTFSKNCLVAMGNCDKSIIEKLKEIGLEQFERVAELPFWDDYAELLKSEIADMKNIGGREAGSITAGKFLEKFTDYPYLHLDIAGPTFTKTKDSYRGTGASGFGVRLLYNFLKNWGNE